MHAVYHNALRRELGGLVGTSASMQCIYKLIQQSSEFQFPVLILGETGTGKELVARSVHFMGPRRHKPFVVVDCAALVPTLIEAELFGYARGTLTGTFEEKQGLLGTAEEGTLFLDEIGDLPTDLQSKLLRVIEEKQFRPIGSNNVQPFKSRIIAATHRDLEEKVKEGTFREDLYFRLNIVQIKLPSLRERKSDIPLLVTSFLEKLRDSDQTIPTISEDAMGRLIAYDWPGNVRELENAIERAVALRSGPTLHIADLPPNIQQGSSEKSPDSDELMTLDDMERRLIFRALRETNGHKLAAARLLRIGKTTLYRRLKRYTSELLNQQ